VVGGVTDHGGKFWLSESFRNHQQASILNAPLKQAVAILLQYLNTNFFRRNGRNNCTVYSLPNETNFAQ
jgi:hypothetical protein